MKRIAEGRERGLNGAAIQRWLHADGGIALSSASVWAAIRQLADAEVEQAEWEGTRLRRTQGGTRFIQDGIEACGGNVRGQPDRGSPLV
jgi:hypothetical protein